MKSIVRFTLCPALCGILLAVSLPVLAMSSSPEDEAAPAEPVSLEEAKAGKYGKQFENRDPEADARAAIDKGDLRLLGFASRVTSVPGVSKDVREKAMETCGVRLMVGFGDVIRSDKELAAMRLASAYAKRYNAVMVEACFRKD